MCFPRRGGFAALVAAALLLLGSTAFAAAAEPTKACSKCLLAVNDEHKACLAKRGHQGKDFCNKALNEKVRSCQGVCAPPAGK